MIFTWDQCTVRTLETKSPIDEGSRKGRVKQEMERRTWTRSRAEKYFSGFPTQAKDIRRSSRAWTPLFTITLSQAWARGSLATGQEWISWYEATMSSDLCSKRGCKGVSASLSESRRALLKKLKMIIPYLIFIFSLSPSEVGLSEIEDSNMFRPKFLDLVRNHRFRPNCDEILAEMYWKGCTVRFLV
eukprot:TRINITY_DN11371_c0_g1_i1.p1 TRINITY_DN11371_c0_g1~~TRINITY_DN11371_c0_g1_i1.p1  ORF type:complete len:187 (+),score=17.68 TRINITY_DN11371_c0_g1_i1:1206-1766(+)